MGVSGAYDSVVYAVPFCSRTVTSYIDLFHNLVKAVPIKVSFIEVNRFMLVSMVIIILIIHD